MPFKKRPYSKKRTFKKKYASKAVLVTRPKKANLSFKNMVNMGVGFPKKLMMKHRYADQVQLSCSVGSPGAYVWSANSLYDPNVTSSGHQAMYFDQMVQMYERYHVIGSKITVRVVQTVANAVSQLVSLTLDENGSQVTTLPIANIETAGVKQALIPPNSNSTYTLTNMYSARKVHGGSSGVLNNSDLYGDNASSPNNQSFYIVNMYSVDGVTTSAVFLDVLIEYIAIWTDFKETSPS